MEALAVCRKNQFCKTGWGFQEKIPSHLAVSTKRSKVTQFIAVKKSRQEFKPLIGIL